MIVSLIFVAGIGQLALATASLAIPRVLNWKQQTALLRPLTRQVFWTYAGYIWATNVCFGVVSVMRPESLVDGRFLAIAVSAFITVYWTTRVVIQFAYFDRRDAPSGFWFVMAESILVGLFVTLAAIYGWAVVVNLTGALS